MCLSPHEMSAGQVRARIEQIKERLTRPLDEPQRQMWQWRLEAFQDMLREYERREAAQADLARQVELARAAVAEAERLVEVAASAGVYQLAA